MNARVVAPRQLFLGASEHQPVDFSKVLLHGCNHSVVKNNILAFRRGPIRYRRNAMIVCEGDPADYIYIVVNGTVRSCRTYQDGSRGIAAFYFSGEIFGLTGDPAHSLSLEAVTDTLILFFKRKDLLSTAARDIKIANYLLAATTNELRRIQEHSLMLGRLATRRVAAFCWLTCQIGWENRNTSNCRCPSSILLIILGLRWRLSVGPSPRWKNLVQSCVRRTERWF